MNLLTILRTLVSNPYLQLIVSAFFGGFFAGWFTNHYEAKRRLSDKRRDKFFDHKNTIVQIEHELLPTRVNLSRNIESLEDSISNTNDANKRVVLRFYKLHLSPGLSLHLLDLKLINLYAEMHSLFETINNDIEYVNQMIASIVEDKKFNRVDENLIETYIMFSEYLLREIKMADEKSLNLLAYCRVVLSRKDKNIISNYVKNGDLIKYKIDNKTLKQDSKKIIKQETKPFKKNEPRPQFITPFLDLKRVVIPTVGR